MVQAAARAPSPLVLLGLVARRDEAERYATRLGDVAAAWPMAMAAQLAAGIGVVLVDRAALPAALVALLGTMAAAATLLPPPAQRCGTALRTRLLALASALSAGGLLSLLPAATQLADPAAALACVVAVTGAIAITTVSVHAVRAATLGVAVGLTAALAPIAPGMLPIAIAFAFTGLLGITTLRLARIDYAHARRRAEAASEGRLAAKMVAEFEGHGTGWFWEADRNGRFTYLSAKVATALAGDGAWPIGRPITDVLRMDRAGTERTLAFHLSSRTSFSDYSVCAAHDAAGERWWSISGRPVVDDLGRFKGFIGSGTDLTEKRRSEAEITRLALFDSLTGLANRQRMRAILDKTLTQQVGPYRPAALFLMDLDRFKAVNDTLGHQAGDALLKQVAQRLERGVGEAGLVGRLGGDEFQVLLPGVAQRDWLGQLARDLIGSLSQPYAVAGTTVSIGCSIGIAIAPEHGDDAEALVRNADLALYAAKGDGRGVHRFYSDEMLAGARSRKQLEDDLRVALGRGDFQLAYQPVVSTRSACISGYEALLRWDHPLRGAISPAEFVPVAEDCGLIEAIGEWVLRSACAEAARWPRDVRVAVNVSPIQFANPGLPALVASALGNSGLAPDRLELEITEGVFLDGSQSTDQMFRALKNLGVRLALDDFGTGYSSLGYLRTAPFDKIKIDQSFVRGAAQPGNRNAAIIKAIVTLADTLGMETTAEGVELQDEIALIRELGCSHIQGYVYGQGLPAPVVREQLGIEGAQTPTGHRTSRAPRFRMLRSARLALGGTVGDVRIRDLSTTGALIDGIELEGEVAGLPLQIEMADSQWLHASLVWAKQGRAGLRFAEPIDPATLMPASPLRRAG